MRPAKCQKLPLLQIFVFYLNRHFDSKKKKLNTSPQSNYEGQKWKNGDKNVFN